MAEEQKTRGGGLRTAAIALLVGGSGFALWYYLARKKCIEAGNRWEWFRCVAQPPTEQPPTCPEGQVWDEALGQCVPAQPVQGEPKSQITAAAVSPASGVEIVKGQSVHLAATVVNVGNAPGYFKVYGYLYNAGGPTGSSGYNVSGWDQVDQYVTGNARGVRFESSWAQIDKQGSYSFELTSKDAVNWTGYAHLWIVAAVSTEATTESRIKANEHYYFAQNVVSIKEAPVTAGPLAHIGARTYSIKA